MSEQPNQSKTLSEISHLFLSSVREKAQGTQRPMRVAPAPAKPRTDVTVDLTPEEFAHVFGGAEQTPEIEPVFGPVSAVLASHLGAQQLERVREYAAYICGPGERLGLIAVDASELRLSIFEQNSDTPPATSHETEMLDTRRMTEALEELAGDVDRWLLLLPSPRSPEARALLRDVKNWTVLSTSDPEGVVSCYRSLKGLSDLHRPSLSLAVVETNSDIDANGAHRRLASVCQQFLNWSLENEGRVTQPSNVTEHLVLWCSGAHDKAQLATAPQWQVVQSFIARSGKMPSVAAEPSIPVEPIKAAAPVTAPPEPFMVAAPAQTNSNADLPQVIDLPDGRGDAGTIITAIIRGGHDLIECPIKPPMCSEASLAVSRDHRLVLLAVAGQGLGDLRDIGRAYQWMLENRQLITMAVPQMSIDPHQLPRLHLLIDHADMSAQILQPILQSGSVSVHTYRKLSWHGKTGLLVEAA
ncbi:MAG TPA: hypothetical protein VHD56_13715 [Tepidisphaeraceae bacterium]|nr:hypothetical protein [Tepidisphaeraceae bacterium]